MEQLARDCGESLVFGFVPTEQQGRNGTRTAPACGEPGAGVAALVADAGRFIHRRAGVLVDWIESALSDPLAQGHSGVEPGRFAQQLNRAHLADALDLDQLVELSLKCGVVADLGHMRAIQGNL